MITLAADLVAESVLEQGDVERGDGGLAGAPEPPDDEPLIRVMALHALQYCERLFYLEEVEEIRVADERVYAGRDLHELLDGEDESGTEHRSFALASETLG